MNLIFREAMMEDLPFLVEMLSDDVLGAQREDTSKPLNKSYISMFNSINSDPNNYLVVVENEGNLMVGMLQLTFIPYLTHIGSRRCLIEGVRIHKKYRGRGLGAYIVEWATEYAKNKECSIVQLTSDKQRPEAIRFYENQGFKATHEGLKLKL